MLRNFPNRFEINADAMTAQCPTFYTVTLLCEKMQYFSSRIFLFLKKRDLLSGELVSLFSSVFDICSDAT